MHKKDVYLVELEMKLIASDFRLLYSFLRIMIFMIEHISVNIDTNVNSNSVIARASGAFCPSLEKPSLMVFKYCRHAFVVQG